MVEYRSQDPAEARRGGQGEASTSREEDEGGQHIPGGGGGRDTKGRLDVQKCEMGAVERSQKMLLNMFLCNSQIFSKQARSYSQPFLSLVVNKVLA